LFSILFQGCRIRTLTLHSPNGFTTQSRAYLKLRKRSLTRLFSFSQHIMYIYKIFEVYIYGMCHILRAFCLQLTDET